MGKRKVKLGNVTDVDIRLLKIFQTVVDSGGLSAAEVELGIGRSTISTHLADIEARLGMRLCDRGRSGFALTSDGVKVYQASIGLMKSLEIFQSEVNALHGVVAGELKVGLVDNVIWDTSFSIVKALRSFAEIGSEVELNLYICSPDEIEKRIYDGSLHVALAPIMHQVSGLSTIKIFDETCYLYCGSEHELFHLPDEQINDQVIARCNYVRKGYAVNADLQETNENLNHHVNAYHVEAIATMVLTGLYIGFLPENYAKYWVERRQMRCIRPQVYKAQFEFGVVSRKSRLSSAANAFIDCLVKTSTY